MPTITPTPNADTGGAADATEVRPTAPAETPAWPLSRKIGTGLAGIGALLGVLLALAGVALIGVHGFGRDGDGYYNSGTERLQSDRFAISAEHLDLGTDPGGPAPADLVGDLRIEATSTDGEKLFVGIAPTADLERYLREVGHSELADFDGGVPTYEQHPGDSRPKPPGAEDFWAASSQGPGEQRLEWEVSDGVWSLVVMNADGSRGIVADARAGVQIGWLLWAGIGLATVGAILAAGATALIVSARRRASASRS
jgi:hypothetical protein